MGKLESLHHSISEMTEDDLKTISLKDLIDVVNEENPDDAKITLENYHEALSISERGKTVVLKRKPSEIWVNNYNPHFMQGRDRQ